MFQYKKVTELTDEEIRFVLRDIFPEITEICEIKRVEKGESIGVVRCDVRMTTENRLITFVMHSRGIVCSGPYHFTISAKQDWKWRQYLVAKCCHPLQYDNPYLK